MGYLQKKDNGLIEIVNIQPHKKYKFEQDNTSPHQPKKKN